MARINPKVNYGLWVIMTCECRVIDYNKSTALLGNADNGGGSAGAQRQGTYSHFAVNTKVL